MTHNFPISEKMAQSEDEICKRIRLHFLKQRKSAEKLGNKVEDPVISEDINYITQFIYNTVSNPVSVLKAIGIIFMGRTVALNIPILQSEIISCDKLTTSALRKENWESISDKQEVNLASLVGTNEVKNWTVYNIPQNTNLAKFISDKPTLIASERSFGLDHAPESLLIGPGFPPQDILTAPHFPLVTIQYERDHNEHTVIFEYNEKPKPRLIKLERGPINVVSIDYDDS